jgi:SAM-dependent MidA family methyltransferase
MTQQEIRPITPDLAPEFSRVRNPLAKHIEASIAEQGPMPFDQYMNIWNNGITTSEGESYPGFYNSTHTVIGSFGGLYDKGEYDFATYPEMTPVYGYLMAKQIAQMWEIMDRDPDFQVVEMGGGNGTLAHDIVMGLRHFAPEMNPRYTIVEQSPVLAQRQREKVGEMGVEIVEGSALDSLPQGVKGVFISNELLDDLPAKMLRRTTYGWEELHVTNRDENNFQYVWLPATPEASDYAASYLGDAEVGQEYPVSLAGEQWLRSMSDSLDQGFVITVDYYNMRGTEKFAPVYAKGRVVLDPNTNEADLLFKENVGKANVTSTPDFKAFARAGQNAGLEVEGDVTVGGFVYGLWMEPHLKEIEIMRQEQRIARLGDRGFDAAYTRRTLRTSSQRVLIQSKGIDMQQEELKGANYTFHDGIMEHERFYRERFEPVATNSSVELAI